MGLTPEKALVLDKEISKLIYNIENRVHEVYSNEQIPEEVQLKVARSLLLLAKNIVTCVASASNLKDVDFLEAYIESVLLTGRTNFELIGVYLKTGIMGELRSSVPVMPSGYVKLQ